MAMSLSCPRRRPTAWGARRWPVQTVRCDGRRSGALQCRGAPDRAARTAARAAAPARWTEARASPSAGLGVGRGAARRGQRAGAVALSRDLLPARPLSRDAAGRAGLPTPRGVRVLGSCRVAITDRAASGGALADGRARPEQALAGVPDAGRAGDRRAWTAGVRRPERSGAAGEGTGEVRRLLAAVVPVVRR